MWITGPYVTPYRLHHSKMHWFRPQYARSFRRSSRPAEFLPFNLIQAGMVFLFVILIKNVVRGILFLHSPFPSKRLRVAFRERTFVCTSDWKRIDEGPFTFLKNVPANFITLFSVLLTTKFRRCRARLLFLVKHATSPKTGAGRMMSSFTGWRLRGSR